MMSFGCAPQMEIGRLSVFRVLNKGFDQARSANKQLSSANPIAGNSTNYSVTVVVNGRWASIDQEQPKSYQPISHQYLRL